MSWINEFIARRVDWIQGSSHLTWPEASQGRPERKRRGRRMVGVNGDRSCYQQRLLQNSSACLLYPHIPLSCLVTALVLPPRPLRCLKQNEMLCASLLLQAQRLPFTDSVHIHKHTQTSEHALYIHLVWSMMDSWIHLCLLDLCFLSGRFILQYEHLSICHKGSLLHAVNGLNVF